MMDEDESFDRNPDTALLAEHLRQVWSDAFEDGLTLRDAWYRVAAHAKSKRA